MFKGVKKAKLGRKASHKNALIKNMLRSLFEVGYVTTTTVKAKVLKDNAMKLMFDVKKPTLANLRKATMILNSRTTVEKLVKYVENNEPKIKIVKIGFRDGDKAETSRVSVVGYTVKVTKTENKKEVSKKEIKKETKKTDLPKSIDKTVKQNVTVKKERVRTRSGI